MKLHEYQHAIRQYICDHMRCNVLVPMGLGKTVSTLTAIIDIGEYPVLVVAPYRVAQSTWPDEVEKWAHTRHLKVSVIVGKPKERREAADKKAHIYCINYESLPWLIEHLDGKVPYRMIVADECSKLKGFRTRQGTKRAKALAKLALKVPRYVGLTGTPASNGIIDIWALCWFVDKGKRLGATFTAFRDRWFRAIQVGNIPQAVRYEPYPHSQKEIEDRIRDICMSLEVADYFDLDEPIVNIIKVKLPPDVRDQYREMERDLYLSLHDIEAANAAVKTQKCLQIANGFIYTDSAGNFEPVHDLKLQALESIVEESGGEPLLVAYNFKADLARILNRFPQAKHLDRDPETIRRWNRGEIPMLLAHPRSAGHGLQLQHGGSTIVFYGLDWVLEERLQIIERIGPVRQKQAGYDRPVYIHYIIADRTIDEVVLARVDEKKTVLDTLMEAMNVRHSEGQQRDEA
jgi:SNF2 family DNA or RNA helicase